MDKCGLEEEAMRYWTKLARLGDATGGWKLGEALYKGRGGVTRDLEQAARWLTKTAKQVQVQEGQSECHAQPWEMNMYS